MYTGVPLFQGADSGPGNLKATEQSANRSGSALPKASPRTVVFAIAL